MKIRQEFSKYAQEYESLNVVQNLVAQKLIGLVKNKPKKILDLGCGSGALSKAVDWEYESFLGVDFAEGMLALHPHSHTIKTMLGDFNNANLFERLATHKYDYILSASSLHWAENLEDVFKRLSMLKTPIAFAIFTSNTFKTLHETAAVESTLLSSKQIQKIQKKYFNAAFEVVEYKLEFESVREMFKYIKRSGVGAKRNVLGVKEMRKLMQEYPLNYLEFEVVFISS